MLHSLLLE